MPANYPRTRSKKFRMGKGHLIESNNQKLERMAISIGTLGGYRCRSMKSAISLASALNAYYNEMRPFPSLVKGSIGSSLKSEYQGYYASVKNHIGWKIIFEIPPKRIEVYKGIQIEERIIKTKRFDAYENDLFDKNGVMDESEWKRRQADTMLQRRIGEGACGGVDEVGGPCEESYNHFIKLLGHDRIIDYNHRDEDLDLREGKYGERTFKDGSKIQWVVGDGSHTHIGKDRRTGKRYISIKDEKTEKHIHWDLEDE